ncbi:MAG: hypothetical protein HQK53_17575 [Oligoflexia bacterium]|nr:hypothetical protein [Oligoflexia bacterium]
MSLSALMIGTNSGAGNDPDVFYANEFFNKEATLNAKQHKHAKPPESSGPS